jgi:large subunit ribosomal protein L2
MAVVRVAPRVAVTPVTPWGKTPRARAPDKNKASQKLIIRSRHAKKKGR